MPTCYLNGRYVQRGEARVSALDRGFLFGDGVYEVIPAYGGRLFRLPGHLARLRNSLAGIRMESPLSDAEWQQVLQRLLQLNPAEGGDQSIYLQVTRGAYEAREHAFPRETRPTVFAMCTALTVPDN